MLRLYLSLTLGCSMTAYNDSQRMPRLRKMSLCAPRLPTCNPAPVVGPLIDCREACPGVAYHQLLTAPSAPTYIAALPLPHRLRAPAPRVLPTGGTASASSGGQPAQAKVTSPFATNTVAAVINNAAAAVPATEMHASVLWDAALIGAGGRLPVTTMVIKDASAFLLDDVQQVVRVARVLKCTCIACLPIPIHIGKQIRCARTCVQPLTRSSHLHLQIRDIMALQPQVYRDVLTGSLMASGGTDVGSVVLCLEGSLVLLPPPPPPPVQQQHLHHGSDPPSVASLPLLLRQQTSGGLLQQLPVAVALSSVAANATPPLTPAGGRRGITGPSGTTSTGNVSVDASAAVPACGCASTCTHGCAAALAQAQQQHGPEAQDAGIVPAPGRLALYLVFAETLPAGVLQMVEAELKQLMPVRGGQAGLGIAECDCMHACILAKPLCAAQPTWNMKVTLTHFSPHVCLPPQLFFSALRCAITSGGPMAAGGGSSSSLIAADWRLLHMQLTGMRNVLSTLTSPLVTANGFPHDAAAGAAGASYTSSSAHYRCTPASGAAASAVASGAAGEAAVGGGTAAEGAVPLGVVGDTPPPQQFSGAFSVGGTRSGGPSSRSSGDAGAPGPVGPSSVGVATMPRAFSALDQVPEDPSSREGSDGRANNNGSRSGSGLPTNTTAGAAAPAAVGSGSPSTSRVAPRSVSLTAAHAAELPEGVGGRSNTGTGGTGTLESARSRSGSTTRLRQGLLQATAGSGPISTSRNSTNNNLNSGAGTSGTGHLQRALAALRARLGGGGGAQASQQQAQQPASQPRVSGASSQQQQQLPALTIAMGSVGSNPAGIEVSNSSRFAKSLLRLASTRGAAAAAAVSTGGGAHGGSRLAAVAAEAGGTETVDQGTSGEKRRMFLRTESGPATVSDAAPQTPHAAAAGAVSAGPTVTSQSAAGPVLDARVTAAVSPAVSAGAASHDTAKQMAVSVGLLADLMQRLPGPHRSSPALLLENESDPMSAAIAAAAAAGEPPTRASTGDLMNSAGSARESGAVPPTPALGQQQAQAQQSAGLVQAQQGQQQQPQRQQQSQQQQQNTELLVSTVRSRLTAVLAGSEDSGQAR